VPPIGTNSSAWIFKFIAKFEGGHSQFSGFFQIKNSWFTEYIKKLGQISLFDFQASSLLFNHLI